jgi:hypothetical protein
MGKRKELEAILEESFLGDLIEKGIKEFEYKDRVLYQYDPVLRRHKKDSGIKVTTGDVLSLAKKIADLFSKKFNTNESPMIRIKEEGVVCAVTIPPATEDVYFYLHLDFQEK